MSETRTKEGRIAISALPIEYADDALVGELMVDRKTGQMAVKTADGVASFDANMAVNMAENKVLSTMRIHHPKFKGSMFYLNIPSNNYPMNIDEGGELLTDPLLINTGESLGVYVSNFKKVPLTLTLVAKVTKSEVPDGDKDTDLPLDGEEDEESIVMEDEEIEEPEDIVEVEEVTVKVTLPTYPYIEELVKVDDHFTGYTVEAVHLTSITVDQATVINAAPIIVKSGGVK